MASEDLMVSLSNREGVAGNLHPQKEAASTGQRACGHIQGSLLE
jgi:hypothetical protein